VLLWPQDYSIKSISEGVHCCHEGFYADAQPVGNVYKRILKHITHLEGRILKHHYKISVIPQFIMQFLPVGKLRKIIGFMRQEKKRLS
jgi:hypothetical protein